MKRTVAIFLVALAMFWFPERAKADEYTAISGATASATSVFFDKFGTYQGTSIDIGGFSKVIVQATCTASCPATVSVLVQVKAITSDTFSTVCTIPNPDVSANGVFQCIGPGAGYLQIGTSGYVSGTYSVTVRTMK